MGCVNSNHSKIVSAIVTWSQYLLNSVSKITYFLKENGRTATVNMARYLDMLQTKFYPGISEFAINNPDEDPSSWVFM